MKILLLDNYDSFTWMLKDYIEQCGVSCTVKRSDDVSVRGHIADASAVVISPGPCRPDDSGSLMQIIGDQYDKKPMLGVCLGHQALGEFFGARLTRAIVPRHGKTDLVHHKGDELFAAIPFVFQATRYHSLVLDQIPDCLHVIAVSDNNENMGIRHSTLPLWGIQFHPESCMTKEGLTLIKNFTDLAKKFA